MHKATFKRAINIVMACVLAAAAAVVVSSVPARADAAADARKAIQGLYDKTHAAEAKKDAETMMSIYSTNVVVVDVHGKSYTLQDIRKQTATVFLQSTSISGSTTVLTITLKGSFATVSFKEHSKLIGPDPVTKTASTMIVDTSGEDQWFNGPAGWRLTRSVTHHAKASLNGRPVL